MDVTENDAWFALRRMALTFYLDVKSKQKDQVAISPNNECLSVVGLKLAFASCKRSDNKPTSNKKHSFALLATIAP